MKTHYSLALLSVQKIAWLVPLLSTWSIGQRHLLQHRCNQTGILLAQQPGDEQMLAQKGRYADL